METSYLQNLQAPPPPPIHPPTTGPPCLYPPPPFSQNCLNIIGAAMGTTRLKEIFSRIPITPAPGGGGVLVVGDFPCPSLPYRGRGYLHWYKGGLTWPGMQQTPVNE